MTNNCNNYSNSIKVVSKFSILDKAQKPIKEITYFAKDFSLFAKFLFN